MVSQNYVPERVNEWNIYLDGNRMVGVANSLTLPELSMQTADMTAAGILGTISSPTIAQFESFEQEIQFNTLYCDIADMMNPMESVKLTLRAAMQVYDRTGGYVFKGVVVNEVGSVKKVSLGKIEKGEATETSITLELTYIKLTVDGEERYEVDKLNSIYKINGQDVMIDIASLV